MKILTIMTGVKTKMKIRLNEAFDYSPISNHGIFHYLQSLDVPWKDKNINAHLDYYYHLNHSGKKITSPLIDEFMDSTNKISSENIAEIANIIYSLFGTTWDRLWDVYNIEYNPINNYDMTETLEKTDEITYGKKTTRTDDLTETRTDDTIETRRDNLSETRTDDLTETVTDDLTETRTDDLTETRTDDLTETRTDDLTETRTDDTLETKRVNNSETRTDDLTQTETPEQTKTTVESVYGFDSDEAQPSREISETNGGLLTKTQEGTVETESGGTETRENDGTVTTTQDGTVTTTKEGTETTTKEGTVTTTKEGTVTTENENVGTTENDGTVTTEQTGTQELEDSGKDTTEIEHTLTRYGNIGVTTTQQMLQSEIALWEWNFFKTVVFPNIDGVLTIALY